MTRTRTTSLMRTRTLNITSFKATSSRQRSRTSSFRNNQLQTTIFDNFIFDQLPDSDQPFKGTKQLSKKPCFTTTSFSKQKLERLNLTRSILEHDQHNQQLQTRQSEQLCADHLPTNSFHRNKQQQQLIQQSFENKMKTKQLRAFQSQLRPEQPARAYSSMSLQQLTPSNSLESFQLPSSALLLATLVVIHLGRLKA